MKKRITAVLLGTALLAGTFTGCGSQKDAQEEASATGNSSVQEETGSSTEAETNEATEDETTDDESASDGELAESVWQWPGEAPEGLQEVEDALNEMTEKDIGVHITLYPCVDFENQIVLDVSTGTQVDLCLTIGGIGRKVDDGILLPMDDIIEEYGQDIIEDCADALKGGYYNGKLYGVPTAWVLGEGYAFMGDAAVMDECGFTFEENKTYSLDEIEEIFAATKAEKGDNFYPAAINNQSVKFIFSSFEYDYLCGGSTSTGVLMLNDGFDNTTIENLYDTEEYEEYARRMYDWVQKGYISKDAATDTEFDYTHVAAGNSLGVFRWGSKTEKMDASASLLSVDTYALNVIPAYVASYSLGGVLWSIPATSANPAKALETLNYIYQHDEAAWLLQFGIEGRDYKITEEVEIEGKVQKRLNYLAEDRSSLPYYQPMGVYGDRLSWPIRGEGIDIYNNQLLREREAAIPDDRKSPAMGYVFVKSDVSAEIAAVDAVISRYEPTILCGAADPDVILPEFRKALKDAGIDKIIAENQRQFDEWLATQN